MTIVRLRVQDCRLLLSALVSTSFETCRIPTVFNVSPLWEFRRRQGQQIDPAARRESPKTPWLWEGFHWYTMMPLSRKVSDVFIFARERVNRVVTSFEVDIASNAFPLWSCCNISTWNGIVFLRIKKNKMCRLVTGLLGWSRFHSWSQDRFVGS